MGVTLHTLRVTNGTIINHCHIIWDEFSRDAIFIDPAWELQKFTGLITSYHLKPKAVLLTHHHFDHTNLADVISNHYRIPVYISRTESLLYGYETANLTWIPQGEMKLGTIEVKPISTPGHTAGGVCYRISDLLLTGDTLFIEGCGVCWGGGADPIDMFHSLQRLKGMLHAETRIYPGHRYVSELGQTFDYVKKNNVYLNIDDVNTFVRFRMRKNQKKLFQFI